jgi:hypothetical protein
LMQYGNIFLWYGSNGMVNCMVRIMMNSKHSPWNNLSRSRANIRRIETLCQSNRKCYFTCQTPQADFNLDQGASRCVLSNSWSDIGTKLRPRIVQVPLVPTLKWGGMRGGGWCHNSVKTGIYIIL